MRNISFTELLTQCFLLYYILSGVILLKLLKCVENVPTFFSLYARKKGLMRKTCVKITCNEYKDRIILSVFTSIIKYL